MSNTTWQIVSKRESVYNKLDPKHDLEQEIFLLAVTAESEHQPGTVYQWRGKIEIDESGDQHLNRMFLDGPPSVDREISPLNIDVHTWITHEEDPAAAFEKVARACDEHTQWIEKNFVEQVEKERQYRERVSATTLCLQQLATEGIHPESAGII